ncbi:MAG: YHYH protein [Akkermansiaceae bacterium]
MKTSLHLPLIALSILQSAGGDPLVDSWHTSSSGSYARLFETSADEAAGNSVTTWSRGQGIQALPTYAGVHEISFDDTRVYVRSTGLGTHIMGPWYMNEAQTNLFPNYPANRAFIYQFPRNPGTPPAEKELTGLGRIGLFVDGVAMFDSRDAFSYDTSASQDDNPMAGAAIVGDGVWNRDAYVNEGVTFDAANAHQAGASYHYHANPPALRHQLGDSVDYDANANRYTENFNGSHSPILGWVNDGYPIYGPYGYSEANDPASAVRRMISGFRKRSITQRQTLPAYAARDQNRPEALPANLHGPDVSAQFVIGHYLEDYEYLGDLGFTQGVDFDLNEYNMRFCVTPEFPGGTYAYFVCIEADGTPAFPYNIGRKFFGNATGGVVPNIPANAEIAFEGGPETPHLSEVSTQDGEVTLTWSALEGGTYVVEESSDLGSWQPNSFNQLGNQLTVAGSGERKFFRTELLSIEPFDDAGFVYDGIEKPTPNNILLVIVDDWGIDASPLDNPDGANLASMPTWASLASQGMRFTNAYAQPTCSPTRAGILSGRYSFRHGIGSPAGATFPAAETSLPEALANATSPFALASFGKWHLGGGDNGPAELGGWTEFRGTLASGVPDFYDWDKVINGVVTPVTDTYATTDQVDDAVDFIESQNDNPWFCWLAFNAPHTPIHEPPVELLPSNPGGGSNQARYRKALEALDTELARLLESVDLTKTNIFLIGDNGTPPNLTQAPIASDKAKGTLYEGGIRVPFIALGPDVRSRGTRDDLVHCVDLFTTVLELANVPLPAETVIDGRSLMPALTGSGPVEGGVLLENFGGDTTDPGRALRLGDYKLHLYNDGREEFYNVVEDISEGNDLLLGSLSPEEFEAYEAIIDWNEELDQDNQTEADGILNVTPASGVAGSSVTLTINFDPDRVPAVPGIARGFTSLTLGGVQATNISRPSRYVAQATFTLPNNPGNHAIEAVFDDPQMRTFGLNEAFEVTP